MLLAQSSGISWEVVTLLLGILATIITAIMKFVPQREREPRGGSSDGGGSGVARGQLGADVAGMKADVAVLKAKFDHLEGNFNRAYAEQREEGSLTRMAIEKLREAVAELAKH